jgi:hypothetical protein
MAPAEAHSIRKYVSKCATPKLGTIYANYFSTYQQNVRKPHLKADPGSSLGIGLA